MAVHPGDVTQLLENWRQGNSEALEELLPLVYRELRKLAASYLRRERQGHTLQPTALVHEAYLRLSGDEELEIKDRAHFFAIAARAMRRILVDHARRHHAAKRVGADDKVPLDDAPALAVEPDVDLLALNEALDRLAEVSQRQARLVELRYFGGLTNAEAAQVLEVSEATVERDWKVARLSLRRYLGGA